METYYKVEQLPNPIIIRVENEQEETILGQDKHISLNKANVIVFLLNNGLMADTF